MGIGCANSWHEVAERVSELICNANKLRAVINQFIEVFFMHTWKDCCGLSDLEPPITGAGPEAKKNI